MWLGGEYVHDAWSLMSCLAGLLQCLKGESALPDFIVLWKCLEALTSIVPGTFFVGSDVTSLTADDSWLHGHSENMVISVEEMLKPFLESVHNYCLHSSPSRPMLQILATVLRSMAGVEPLLANLNDFIPVFCQVSSWCFGAYQSFNALTTVD